MRLFIEIVSALLVCLNLGCGRDQRPAGVYVDGRHSANIVDLNEEDAILYVNGDKITRADFEDLYLFRENLWCLRMKQSLPDGKALDESRAEAGPHIMMELIHRKLFDQYAREISAEPSEESVKAAEKKFLAQIGFPNLSIKAFSSMFVREGAARLASKVPYYVVLDRILRQSVVTNDLMSVTDEELAARKAFVKAFDKNAEEFNAQAIARLNVSRERILKGESTFEQEAAASSDRVNPGHGKFWGEFQIQEFPPDEELSQWLKSAEVGAISQPLDTDDGISIVKLLAKGKGEAPAGQPLPDTYRLAKCTEKACEKMRFQTDDEMRSQLMIWKQEDAQRLLGCSLTSKAVIEYPRGTNLFDRVVKH